ncbi:hypothetical protein OESDEN_09198 [Oesophagostomum dentatum]|uniref:Uncharacterized protein n=1 Tax=Oesophagostomum dentatum TaxID=61180 RepID=A0A0B1T066_OESDE|nr:hypothetical protein OESDEN_09198 [Oesophagostomum dentatum]
MTVMRMASVWFTQRVYISVVLICSVTLMFSSYSRYQTTALTQFLLENRKCILAKTARLNAKKLWESMHTIVNVCSSKNYFATQHYENEVLDIDHIKTYTENFDCTIASYGLSQSFSVEQILSTEEPTCLLFAVDSDRSKGSHFKKIGEFFLTENLNKEGVAGGSSKQKRQKREAKDSAEPTLEEAEVPKEEQVKVRGSRLKSKDTEKDSNDVKEESEPAKEVINTKLEAVIENPSDRRGLSELKENNTKQHTIEEKVGKGTGLMNELNNGNAGLHNVVEKVQLKDGLNLDSNSFYPEGSLVGMRNSTNKSLVSDASNKWSGSEHKSKKKRVPAKIPKSILNMDLETFLLKHVKRNLIYQLSINVANGFDALEKLSSSKMRDLDICQVNIVLPKPAVKEIGQFASFFDDIMSKQYLMPVWVDFVDEEYTR